MPIIKSAKKRVTTAAKAQQRNNITRSKYRSAIKKVVDLMHDAKSDEAASALPNAFKQIDLAVKKNVIHANTGARRKSALSKLVSPNPAA